MKFSAILLGVALYLYLVSSTEASISTNTPFNAVTWNGGNNEQVIWADDGKAPSLLQIGLTTVDLMVGGPNSQFLAGNIGKVDASVGRISYNVPKTIGPPGNFYFIKYSAANNLVAFSGLFSIAGVSGTINGFDPKNPNGTASATPASPANPANSTTPLNSVPSASSSQTSSTPPAYPAKTPADTLANSTSSSGTTDNTATKSPLPATLSNAANLLPGFVGVATTVIALTLTCLY